VGLEPSCTAVFRHEAPSLLPDDPRANAVKEGTFTLAEVLRQRPAGWMPPAVRAPGLVQRHCHQYAVMGSTTTWH